MRTVLIVQARMGSSRLPGKTLLPLGDVPLIVHVIRRLQRCKQVDDIIYAIPDSQENADLVKTLTKHGVKIFAGSEEDVLGRYYCAASIYGADYICRFPADNPVPEPRVIDQLIDFHKKQNPDGFSSNIADLLGSGFPDGIGAEIFNMSLLKKAALETSCPKKREHPHLNFYDYSSGKPINEVLVPVRAPYCPTWMRRPDICLDINTLDDYSFMAELFEALYPENPLFGIKEIIYWWDNIRLKRRV